MKTLKEFLKYEKNHFGFVPNLLSSVRKYNTMLKLLDEDEVVEFARSGPFSVLVTNKRIIQGRSSLFQKVETEEISLDSIEELRMKLGCIHGEVVIETKNDDVVIHEDNSELYKVYNELAAILHLES